MALIRTRAIVEDRDLGMKAILRRIKSLNGFVVDNGFPENGKTTGRYNMAQLAGVAGVNEFGGNEGNNPPARSFLRSSFDSGIRETKKSIKRNIAVLSEGKISRTKALSNMGKFQVRTIRKKIRFGRFAPLALATIAKKGHATPLLETGQLFDSVQFKVGRFGR